MLVKNMYSQGPPSERQPSWEMGKGAWSTQDHSSPKRCLAPPHGLCTGIAWESGQNAASDWMGLRFCTSERLPGDTAVDRQPGLAA